MNGEQKRLVDQTYENTRKLSAALDSFFILASMESQSYSRKTHDICIHDLFEIVRERVGDGHVHWEVETPHMHITGNREYLAAILKDVAMVFSEIPNGASRSVSVEANSESGLLVISFRAPLAPPTLSSLESSSSAIDTLKMIGGMQGVMLSMANELAKYVNGTVELEEVITGEFVEDGTVELQGIGADEHRVTIRLPLQPRILTQSCSRRLE